MNDQSRRTYSYSNALVYPALFHNARKNFTADAELLGLAGHIACRVGNSFEPHTIRLEFVQFRAFNALFTKPA